MAFQAQTTRLDDRQVHDIVGALKEIAAEIRENNEMMKEFLYGPAEQE